MRTPDETPSAVRSRRRRWSAVGLVSALGLAACGGATEPAALAPAPPAAEAAPATDVATTIPTTTSTSVSTSAPTPSTTPSTTSSTVPLPQPIAPPTDVYAEEPIIEVGSIQIPKIDVDATMYEGIRLTTLDHGPGHWPGSATPGQVGNLVVGGHRTSSHRVFRNIDQLEPGDEIVFRDTTGEFTYAVSRVEIVDPSAIWIVEPSASPTATLFACHPPGSTAERIVVFADLVASVEA